MTDNTDYLTGLYNRKGIAEQFEALPPGSRVHMMFCDLDNFKSVNDIYGHASGDVLLTAFADLLRAVAPEAVAGRLGGDEFVLIFVGDSTREHLAQVASEMITQLRISRRKLQFFTLVSVSIGIVYDERSDTGLDQIMGKSDSTMYQAKQRGKSCYLFYDELEERIRMQNQIESQAAEALEHGRFVLRYLPVNNLQTSCLAFAQIVVLWVRRDGGYWMPQDYEPVFARSGFIRKWNEYVFEMLCNQMHRIHLQGRQAGRFCMQLSRLTYLEDGLGERLREILTTYDIGQEEVWLGICEHDFSFRDSGEVVRALQRLHEDGFHIQLLEFGENFSAFRYLQELPVEAIHLQAAYLHENLRMNSGRRIIKTLIRLGRDLKQHMVADGVADAQEAHFLMACGCDAASGPYFSDLLEEEDYLYYVRDSVRVQDREVAYAFRGDLFSTDHAYPGRIIGEGVQFVSGISDRWGGIAFPGGYVGENLVFFPGQLFTGGSFTISLWIRPQTQCAWASVMYAQFLAEFVSIVPFASDGISIYRICEEEDLNGWHDVLIHAPEIGRWTFLAVTYDTVSESMRYYFNAQQAGYQVNVPTMYACSEVMLGGDAYQRSFTGTVSAFRVSDRAKSEQEIIDLYESYLAEPGFCGDLDLRTRIQRRRRRMLDAGAPAGVGDRSSKESREGYEYQKIKKSTAAAG